MHSYQGALFYSFFLTLVLTPLMMWLARRTGALDRPHSRKIHSRPIPLLGGAAIYVAFVVAVLTRWDYSVALKGVLLGSGIIFIMGLIDDFHHIPAIIRLVGQIVAAVILVAHGIVIQSIPNFYLSAFITILGVVGLTNALNFLDNMDGLAAGIAAIASLFFFIIADRTQQIWLGYLTISLAGSTLAFLVYNFKPAKIFMGDAGSTFLGFTLASFAIMGEWSYYRPVAITVPLLILGVLIFDTTLITVLRIKDGKVKNLRQWIEHADTDHFSHRLVGLGLGERGAVFFIYLCSAALGVVAVLLRKTTTVPTLIVVAFLILMAFLGGRKLDKAKLRKR